MLPANLSLPPLSSLNPNPSSARQKSNPVLHHGCLMALFLFFFYSLQSYIRFLSRAPSPMHASISCPKADPVLPPSTTGPKSRLVAGQKTSSLAQCSPAALRLRVKYSDFFQSATHAISWNAECAESRRQLDDFFISTICWELPIVQRSGDNSNWPAILFWLPPKKCHILSLLLPTLDI